MKKIIKISKIDSKIISTIFLLFGAFGVYKLYHPTVLVITNDVCTIKSQNDGYHDKDLTEYHSKYECVDAPPKNNNKFIISLTTIPPRFNYLSDLSHLKNSKAIDIIVNIPKDYRNFGSYHNPKNIEGVFYNYVDVDFGPGTKIIGLCNLIKTLPEVIIYLDDDIEYDVKVINDLASMVRPGFVVAGNGGFYTKYNDPYFSYVTYTYMMLRYKAKPCFIKSEAVMGFSGVGIHKSDLNKVCQSPLLWQYYHNPKCYLIDDDWLGRLYHENEITMLANPELIASRGVNKSESDGWSNRAMYTEARIDCFRYPRFGSGMRKLEIRTSLVLDKKSLHDLSEYKGIKQLVRENHLNFAYKFGYGYKIIHETNLEKSHWSKIEIARDFLKSCEIGDVLFYTDYDFLFLANNMPIFKQGSIIMNHGCTYDNNMIMVGNFFLKCDTSLLKFIDDWEKTTRLASAMDIKNDDQIAFNLIKEELGHKLQTEDFYRYDVCENKGVVLGLHFPGGDKLRRMLNVLKKFSNSRND